MLGKKTLKMLEFIRAHNPAAVSEVASFLKVRHNQVIQRLTSLENNGVLFSIDDKNMIHLFKDNPDLKGGS